MVESSPNRMQGRFFGKEGGGHLCLGGGCTKAVGISCECYVEFIRGSACFSPL